MLESIEKLRGYTDAPVRYRDVRELLPFIDAIEREISEMQESRLNERVYWQNEIYTILDTLTGRKRFWGCNLEYPLGEGALSPSEIATREIAERYQLLPVDADGVPIHIGDSVRPEGYEGGKVASIEIRGNGDIWIGVIHDGWNTQTVYRADNVRHYKPRTVEDVLRDVMSDFADADFNDETVEIITARYADELREMLGSDAE